MTSKMSTSVFNGSWQGLATEKGVERATATITKAVTDIGKDARKTVEAITKGSEKIVDAVGKIKSTNNVEQTVAQRSTASTIADGLTGIGESALKMAQHLYDHPDEGQTVVETMSRISQQLTDLTRCAEQASDNSNQLREAVGEAQTTADWFNENDNGGGSQVFSVGNAFGRVCDF